MVVGIALTCTMQTKMIMMIVAIISNPPVLHSQSSTSTKLDENWGGACRSVLIASYSSLPRWNAADTFRNFHSDVISCNVGAQETNLSAQNFSLSLILSPHRAAAPLYNVDMVHCVGIGNRVLESTFEYQVISAVQPEGSTIPLGFVLCSG